MNNNPVTLTGPIAHDLLILWEDMTFPSENIVEGPYTTQSGLSTLSEIREYMDKLPTTDMEILEVIYRYYGERICFIPNGDSGAGSFYFWDGTVHTHENLIEFDGTQDVGYIFANIVSEFYSLLFDFLDKNVMPTLSAFQEASEKSSSKDRVAKQIRKEVAEIRLLTKDFLKGTKLKGFTSTLQSRFKKNTEHFSPENRLEIVFSDGYHLSQEDLESVDTVDELLPLLREPDPGLRNLKKARFTLTDDYEDKGLWKGFLDRSVVKRDEKNGGYTPDMINQDTLQWLFGAAILGTAAIKYLVNITGPRNSGKGSIVSILGKTFGGEGRNDAPGYAPEVPEDAIEVGNKFSRGAFYGARLPYIQEPTEKKIDGPFLKKYAGGGSTTAASEEKFKAKITWKPMGMLTVVSNHQLRFENSDQSLRKRILFFDFPRTFTEDDEDFDLHFEKNIIEHDGESVLRWVLQGAINYLKNGVQIPQTVMDRQAEGFAQSSISVEWMSTMLDHSTEPTQYFRISKAPKSRCLPSDSKTYEKFVSWATTEGYSLKEIPDITVWRNEVGAYLDMSEIEIKRKQTRKTRFYGVVDILEEPELSYVSDEAQEYVNSFAPSV